MSIVDIAMKGGYLMYFLFILSIISVALFIERWLSIRKASKFEEQTYIGVLSKISQNKTADAAADCKFSDSPFFKIFEQGLTYAESDILLAQETIEQHASHFVRSLEKSLGTISTFAAVGPLIGFLGTVTGMIRVFMNLSQHGGGLDIQLLSGGIYEALVTTVGGLIVGIFCIIFHNFLTSKIEAIAFVVEEKVNSVCMHLRRNVK